MRVTFHCNDRKIASSRLRAVIPAIELRDEVEIVPDGDVLVWGKHFLDLEIAKQFKKRVFDVCDDHFDGPNGGYYRKAFEIADLVTCNSEAMRFRIHQMGRIAKVIPDPYETQRKIPTWGEGVLWFGHERNLSELYRVAPKIKQKITIVSKRMSAEIIEWSPEAQEKALAECAVVILPTGRSPCKSANRLLEATMAGKFVVAEPLPAYEEFTDLWIGDIAEGLDFAFANPEKCLQRVRWTQGRIEALYSPKVIGRQWLHVLRSL
jgi:hypothetical protein